MWVGHTSKVWVPIPTFDLVYFILGVYEESWVGAWSLLLPRTVNKGIGGGRFIRSLQKENYATIMTTFGTTNLLQDLAGLHANLAQAFSEHTPKVSTYIFYVVTRHSWGYTLYPQYSQIGVLGWGCQVFSDGTIGLIMSVRELLLLVLRATKGLVDSNISGSATTSMHRFGGCIPGKFI